MNGEPFIIVYGPELASYSFSDDHPLQAGRYVLTMGLLSELGWLDDPRIRIEGPRFATLSELMTVHSYAYIQAVQLGQDIARGQHRATNLEVYGLGTSDDPLFENMHDAAALYTGATIQGMQALLDGRAVHAYSPAGGQHHAQRAQASGFCIYNDCAAAIALALAAGQRVAYLDFDAHHGDGVQAAFYGEPRALTVSIHESGQYLFPGTGDSDEIGHGGGRGACVNIPLPAFAGDDAVLMAYDRVIEPAVESFSPDIVVTQTGADMHHADPLTHLNGTLALYPQLAAHLHDLVHDCCEGRWLIVGGGGYDPVDVTPRAWASFIGKVLGHDPACAVLPEPWLAAYRAAGGEPPTLLLEDSGPGTATRPSHDFAAVLEDVERIALAEVLAQHGT